MHTNISTSALHTLQYTNNQNKNIPSDKATTVLVPLLKPTGTGHQIRHNITKNLKKKNSLLFLFFNTQVLQITTKAIIFLIQTPRWWVALWHYKKCWFIHCCWHWIWGKWSMPRNIIQWMWLSGLAYSKFDIFKGFF